MVGVGGWSGGDETPTFTPTRTRPNYTADGHANVRLETFYPREPRAGGGVEEDGVRGRAEGTGWAAPRYYRTRSQ